MSDPSFESVSERSWKWKLPAQHLWTPVTDQTERNGRSQVQTEDTVDGVSFRNHIFPISGNDGLVGFALAQAPLTWLKAEPFTSFRLQLISEKQPL